MGDPKYLVKNPLITGASSGIGKASAKLLHDKRWSVIATTRSPDQAGKPERKTFDLAVN